MDIREIYDSPDGTYFRTGDAEPRIEDDGGQYIALTAGRGSRRSWGAPQVNNTVLVDTCDFAAILTGFSHKHGGGQFYRYYIAAEDEGIVRRAWSQLTDDERQIVVDAYNEKAPSWARRPGKLSTERRLPSRRVTTGYKVMRVVDDHLLSLYNDTAWELGKRNGEAVGRDAGYDSEIDENIHNGGYYVHDNEDETMELWTAGKLAPSRCYIPDQEYALVRCECTGREAIFSSGKRAYTYCRPVEILKRFTWSQ